MHLDAAEILLVKDVDHAVALLVLLVQNMAAVTGFEVDHPRRQHVDLLLVLFKKAPDPGERIGFPFVIGVEERDILARGVGKTVVARGGHPGVFLLDIQDVVRVLRLILQADLLAVVGRAVVDEDQLDVLRKADGLGDYGIHGFGEIVLHIIDRYDDRKAVSLVFYDKHSP